MRKARRIATHLCAATLAMASVVNVGARHAAAAGETFKVLTVNTTGCNTGNFGMTVERANLDGGVYNVRTVVTVDGLIYMNEKASISVNGTSGWNIFDNFSYGDVPNKGTYPIPPHTMRLDLTLERPVGTILYAWTLVVPGCHSSQILYNGPTAGYVSDMAVAMSTTGGPFEPGSVVPFTVDVSNLGLVDAHNPKVIVTLPPQFEAGSITDFAVSGPSPGTYTCSLDLSGRVVTCATALHGLGVPAHLTFKARLSDDVPAPGAQVLVQAAVSSDVPDPNPANNSSSVVVASPTFVAITPTRVVDTRVLLGTLAETVAARSTIAIPIATMDAIPDNATSVIVNLTTTQSRSAGFLTLYACDIPRPNTSNSNFEPGVDTANLTISTIAADGTICLFTSAAADLIVDVIGYATGGFTPTDPKRLADTRTTAKPGAGSTLRVPLPAGGAHVLSLTSTASLAAGFLTAYDCDAPRPSTSNLNYVTGVDTANLVIASADGELCVYTNTVTDIVVDHLGTLAAATSALDRLVDTRKSTPATRGTTIQIPAIASANPTAAINLTATESTSTGFLTVHSCNESIPNTSNLNVTPGRDIANLVIIPTDIPMCVTVQANTHVIVDLLATIG